MLCKQNCDITIYIYTQCLAKVFKPLNFITFCYVAAVCPPPPPPINPLSIYHNDEANVYFKLLKCQYKLILIMSGNFDRKVCNELQSTTIDSAVIYKYTII